MKYMLLICTDESVVPDEAGDDDIERWLAEVADRRQDGDRLRPPTDATLVRKRSGELLVTDGPFAETKDWIAGYDVIDCADLDEAIAIAAEHPMARRGQIEIRPFWPLGSD